MEFFPSKVAAKFMIEDDEEQMKEELKEAFRIYDKEGQGFITNEVLKEILREIDSTLTENDLDNIIEEVDEDGSGTMDFDEFQEMMMGWWKYVNKYIVNLIPSQQQQQPAHSFKLLKMTILCIEF